MSFHEKTAHAARGLWVGILKTIGIPERMLVNRHGPCPVCGGEDRFRFDNKAGSGSYFCNVCGAGHGLDLVMKYKGLDFPAAAALVDSIVGNAKPDAPQAIKPEMTEADRLQMLRSAYQASDPLHEGDLGWRYLEFRGVADFLSLNGGNRALRFAPRMKDGLGGVRPCLLSMVGVIGQPKFCNMERIFLRPDGLGKAEMESPVKPMPGVQTPGACVSFGDFGGGVIGVAEGVITAMSAALLYEIPVVAAMTAGNLEKWISPEGVEEIVIFGDNDVNHVGQAAAYNLAKRLLSGPGQKPLVSVKIPDRPGEDFNDVLRARRPQGFRRPEPNPHAIAAE